MCLIVVAHRASEQYPLVVAANRDEDYARPSRPAEWWEGGAVVGGRDLLHGGSWLAISRNGRFAAVTNLRAAMKPPQGRSRGELVANFVRGETDPESHGAEALARATEYGGFHLIAGSAGAELVQVSGAVRKLEPGVHGLSNAPANVVWPKVETAAEAVRGALHAATAAVMAEQLVRVLRQEPAHGDPTRDLFVRGDRYGTRSSTVIIVSGATVLFIEQNYGAGGVLLGPRNHISFGLDMQR